MFRLFNPCASFSAHKRDFHRQGTVTVTVYFKFSHWDCTVHQLCKGYKVTKKKLLIFSRMAGLLEERPKMLMCKYKCICRFGVKLVQQSCYTRCSGYVQTNTKPDCIHDATFRHSSLVSSLAVIFYSYFCSLLPKRWKYSCDRCLFRAW